MKLLLSMVIVILSLPIQSARAESYTCVSLEYPPLIQQGRDGRPHGFAVALVEQIFKQLGHTVTIKIYPWSRSLAMIRLGQADCIFTLYRTSEREQFLDYSQEILARQIVYFYAQDNASFSFNGDLKSVKGFRIGVVRGIDYGPKFEGARATLNINEASTVEQNFRKLAVGRVDLIPSNMYTANATIAHPAMQEYKGKFIKLATPIEVVPSYIGFSKTKRLTTLRDRFDVELRKFYLTDEYGRLLKKHQLECTRDLPMVPAPQC